MADVISLRYPSALRVDGYATIEVHPPYPAQERTAAWMQAQLAAHRDTDGVIDARGLCRAAMRHDGVRWQPLTTSERDYQKLAVYVAHAAGQPWHL